jgi:hypothetical protein
MFLSFDCFHFSFGVVAPKVPTVTTAMKKARDIVQYFNKSTQATKKLKDQQQKSSLSKYSGHQKRHYAPYHNSMYFFTSPIRFT